MNIPESKICIFCGETTQMKRYKNNNSEPLSNWLNREWCTDPECVANGRTYGKEKSGLKQGPKPKRVGNEWKDRSTIHYYYASV